MSLIPHNLLAENSTKYLLQLEAHQLERARLEVRLKAAEQQAKAAAASKGHGKGGGKGNKGGRGGGAAGSGARLEELREEEAALR